MSAYACALAAVTVVLPSAVVRIRRIGPYSAVAWATGALLVYSVMFQTGFFGSSSVYVSTIELAFVALSASVIGAGTYAVAMWHLDREAVARVLGWGGVGRHS